MIKPELLMPAGNVEKLKYAIKYGADAVYLGVVDFSLRAMRKGELITLDNLKLAIDTARQMGAKAYLTLNIFAFNNDIKLLESCMDRIKDSNPDALIISDVGIMRIAQKYMPNTEIHVSYSVLYIKRGMVPLSAYLFLLHYRTKPCPLHG